MYGIDVKIMAQKAGATAVITLNDVIHIKLPYLPRSTAKNSKRISAMVCM